MSLGFNVGAPSAGEVSNQTLHQGTERDRCLTPGMALRETMGKTRFEGANPRLPRTRISLLAKRMRRGDERGNRNPWATTRKPMTQLTKPTHRFSSSDSRREYDPRDRLFQGHLREMNV